MKIIMGVLFCFSLLISSTTIPTKNLDGLKSTEPISSTENIRKNIYKQLEIKKKSNIIDNLLKTWDNGEVFRYNTINQKQFTNSLKDMNIVLVEAFKGNLTTLNILLFNKNNNELINFYFIIEAMEKQELVNNLMAIKQRDDLKLDNIVEEEEAFVFKKSGFMESLSFILNLEKQIGMSNYFNVYVETIK